MSERKVLNKYYPPDFDASKIPRVKREKNRQFVIRLMAPFNMRCTTCGEYIYRGKKFNARKEDVLGKTYLGIQVYRFYIKCTKCLAEITFTTDPENQDYAMENGAIRNFESVRLAAIQAEAEAKQKKDEEVNNPMKVLENRTRDSRREMAVIETLEDLRELNAAHANVDPNILLHAEDEYRAQLERLQQEEDEAEIRRIFGKKDPANPYGYLSDILVQDDDDDNDDNQEEPKEKAEKRKEVKDQESTTAAGAKKVKSEPVEAAEPQVATKATGLTAFLQKKITPASTSKPEESKTQQLKSNAGLFIKKKSETTQVKTEPTVAAKPSPPQPTTSNALAGLLNAYDDSDSDDN